MTKRAGRRKIRMGSQRHPPGPRARPNTLVEDHLRPEESAAIELRAVREGWTLGEGETMERVRSQLMRKLATMAGKETDPDRLCRMVRTLAQSEQREVQLRLIQQAYELRRQSAELPEQAGAAPTQTPAAPPMWEVVQQLISQREIRAALDDRPAAARDTERPPA